MSNVRDAKPRVKTITLRDGVAREIRFTLNAMADLEDQYGSVDAAFKAMESGSIKATRFVLWKGLQDGDENLTEMQVGKLIDIQLMNEIMEGLNEAFGEDMPDADSTGEAKSLPNA